MKLIAKRVWRYGKFSEVQSYTLSEVAAVCGSEVIASDSEVQNQGFELRTILREEKTLSLY